MANNSTTSDFREEPECLDNCCSVQHGRDVCAVAAAASGINAVPVWARKCANYAHGQDEFGRTAMHLVASVGNVEAMEWLIKRAGGNVDKKDKLSGHTPLHRSIYFGQIHTARSLIKFGADISSKDNEGMTPLELCNKDCPREFHANVESDPTELFVWGTNDNYSLGNSIQQSRPVPEQLDVFRKSNAQIMKAIISTYHSVFLSQGGEIFILGNNKYGRLGTGFEKSVLQPEQLQIKSNAKCISIAAGKDHTLFLMENGRVLSCGSNEMGVSGQKETEKQSLVPKTVEIPGKVSIEGIIATRCHSVFYTAYKLFTCGRNCGQLGHSQDKGPAIYEPKLVSQIAWDSEGETKFTHFAACPVATVARANTGMIYVLYKFDCIKINAKHFDVKKLQVAGGSHIDSSEKLGKFSGVSEERLVVLILTTTGRVVVWRQNQLGNPVFSRAIFNSVRVLDITDISLCDSCLLFVTTCGEAYKTAWKPFSEPNYAALPCSQRLQDSSQTNDFKISTGTKRTKGKDSSTAVSFLEYMKIQKIKNVYSALYITSDEAGRNFAIIQSSPKTQLTSLPIVSPSQLHCDLLKFLDETNEEDSLHDVVLKVGNRRFPVHLYIITSGCPKLYSIVVTKLKKCDDDRSVTIDGIPEYIFQQILQFIYSHTCDLLTDGKKIPNFDIPDIMKSAMECARRLDLENMCKALRKFVIANDVVCLKATERRFEISPRRFVRKVNEDLSDILLQSLDNQIFKAHRCVLVARSEYFYSMLFSNVWLEHCTEKPILMQFSAQSLEIFLEYIYEDNISNLPSTDFDALAEILAMSDNLFMERLRTLVEAALADLLSLKNVTSMLYLADRCNALQLKETCMQFIGMNLALVLETRLLDPLPLDLVKDLSTYYREIHQSMRSRSIKRPTNSPTEADFNEAMKNISPKLATEIEASVDDDEIRKPRTTRPPKTKARIPSRVSESDQHESPHSIRLEDPKIVSSPSSSPLSIPTTPAAPKCEPIPMNLSAKKVNFPNPSQTMMRLRNAEAIEKCQEQAKKPLNPTEFPSLGLLGPAGDSPWKVNRPQEMKSPVSPSASTVSGEGTPTKLYGQPHTPTGSAKKKTKWKTVNLVTENNGHLSPKSDQASPSPVTPISVTRDPKNPWKIDTGKKVAFREIVQDEVEKKANFQRAVSKPLNLMQIEDQAINQLTARYGGPDVEDGIEIITVERVCTTNFAPPVWVQHSSISKSNNSKPA